MLEMVASVNQRIARVEHESDQTAGKFSAELKKVRDEISSRASKKDLVKTKTDFEDA